MHPIQGDILRSIQLKREKASAFAQQGNECTSSCSFVFDAEFQLYACTNHKCLHVCSAKCIQQRGINYVCSVTNNVSTMTSEQVMALHHRAKHPTKTRPVDMLHATKELVCQLSGSDDVDEAFCAFVSQLYQVYLDNLNASRKSASTRNSSQPTFVFLAALMQCIHQKTRFISDDDVCRVMRFDSYESSCVGGFQKTYESCVKKCQGAASTRTKAMEKIRTAICNTPALLRQLPVESSEPSKQPT